MPHLISTAMKTCHFIIAAFLLLLAVHSKGQQGINPLEIEITLETDSLTKAALLDSISSKTNVHFSYNPELLGAREKVKISNEKTTIFSILKNITNPEALGFHSLDNQIILYPLKSDENEEKTVVKNQFIIIRGKVTDQKKEEPIPFCNIAIIGKAVGTISNNDGNFSIKIPLKYQSDTLRFSCLGFLPFDIPIANISDSLLSVELAKTVYYLKTVDIVLYHPALVLQNFFENIDKNYNDKYTLFTTFYREIIQENSNYTDVSEAVLKVLKAPYSNEFNDDVVKFIKGRKSSNVQPFDEIKFRLKGGPYYITKLDVIKNQESFINPEFIHLYTYEFKNRTLIDGRATIVISFTPIYNLRDLLYEGLLYFDIETWALSRIEFNYTKQGLQEARRLMIEKEPKGCKAIPTELSYQVQYSLIDQKWYLHSARSLMQIKILNREKKQKTKFRSISEILTTNIEVGNLQHFNRKEIFSPNEFFTEKINGYDKEFWEDYNVIEPEEELNNALKNFEDHDLIITNTTH
jgi:hypothetical protein